MYLDKVKEITNVENETEQLKAAARTQAQQQLNDAEKAGKVLLAEARSKARSENSARLAEAEKKASARREETLRAAEDEARTLCQAAQSRMDRAADEIVRRVVER